MEATPHSTQREITLESLALLRARRPDVQVFNELLVQYPINDHLGQVVPDNIVVLSAEPVEAVGSFNLPFEPAAPFWVLEYVSPLSRRKDYEENFQKCEQELKVPYCLFFYPEKQDLRLYRHTDYHYEQVEPNTAGRLAIPELDLEVALFDRWTHFWHQGKLLPLPAELYQQFNETAARIQKAQTQVEQERRRVQRQKQRAKQEKQRAEEAKQRAKQEKQRAEQAEQQVRQQEQRAQRQKERTRVEKQCRAAAEAEVARLRAIVQQLQARGPDTTRPGEDEAPASS
jgi:Uma2 family endonuclease